MSIEKEMRFLGKGNYGINMHDPFRKLMKWPFKQRENKIT